MSVHINAKKGDIASTVLLPGDPLRAKWIAATFLEEVVCYTEVRGMFGYTGMYKGKKISVQGTGMGIPSALIYCHELITLYGVKNLIRVGSSGAYQKELHLRDIVLAMAGSTTSGINSQRFQGASYAPTANFELFQKAVTVAVEKKIPLKAGNVLSADEFYEDNFARYKHWADFGVLCVDMETAGLYTIAAQHKIRALSILTISDSLVTGKKTSATDREKTFKDMVEIALEIAE